VEHHVAEEGAFGRVGHRKPEELAAGPQPGLARDEATHPVLRGVLLEGGSERARVAGAQAPERNPVAHEILRDRKRRHRLASLTSGGTVALVRRLLVLVAVLAAGCGDKQQGADEPQGEFRLQVVDASFPRVQHVAQNVRLRVRVRNAETEQTLRNVAVTIETAPEVRGDAPVSFGQQNRGADLASAARPIWVLDKGPRGGETAAVNTWLAGDMKAGEVRELTWDLVASRAGTYTIRYRVAPGLSGRGQAVGARTSGQFRVRFSDPPVPARVGEDGEVERGVEPGS
jgi:hypothetical protein